MPEKVDYNVINGKKQSIRVCSFHAHMFSFYVCRSSKTWSRTIVVLCILKLDFFIIRFAFWFRMFFCGCDYLFANLFSVFDIWNTALVFSSRINIFLAMADIYSRKKYNIYIRIILLLEVIRILMFSIKEWYHNIAEQF